jgi:predicted secreted protein
MKMSNYSSKNVLFSSDKEYFYIEKYGIMNKKLILTGALLA